MGGESDTGGHWGHQCTVGEHRCPGGGLVTHCAANIITHCDIPRTANLVSSASYLPLYLSNILSNTGEPEKNNFPASCVSVLCMRGSVGSNYQCVYVLSIYGRMTLYLVRLLLLLTG